jgi:hypothetical protein
VCRDAGPWYGWERHILGGITVVPVPGDHSTVVLGSNAEVLVRSLGAAIAEARRSRESALELGCVAPESAAS